MTNAEKQEIIEAVLAALATNSKTIAQLSPKQSLIDSDLFEVAGGSRVTYLVLKNGIREGLALASQLSDYVTGEQAMIYLAKLDTETGTIDYMESPCVMLDGFKDVNGYSPATGDLYYENKSGYQIWTKTQGGATGEHANTHVAYINRNENAIYRWTGTTMERIGGCAVVNDLTTGGGDKALSAEMGKRLKAKVDEVQANIERLYNNLGNIAFWDDAAKSNAAPLPIDWGNPKRTVTLALTLTNAVVKHNGVVKSNGDTIQVEEGSTLTLIVEPATSMMAITSVTSSTTGASVTDLGDGTYSVSIGMGGNNVTLDVVASASVGDYDVPAGGEMVFFLDGTDLTDGATTWVDKVGNVQFSGSGSVVKVDGVPVGMSFHNQAMSIDSTLNFSPVTHTIEVVAKPITVNGYKYNYLFTDGTQTTNNGGKNEAIHAILYKDGNNMYMNGVLVDGSGTQGQDGSWTNGNVWSMPFTLDSNICIGANKTCAVNNGVQMSSNGEVHWTTLYGKAALGGARNNQNGFFYSDTVVYAIRIYRGQLTAEQMLHNQKIDNIRYKLGLTLPDSVS